MLYLTLRTPVSHICGSQSPGKPEMYKYGKWYTVKNVTGASVLQ